MFEGRCEDSGERVRFEIARRVFFSVRREAVGRRRERLDFDI